MKYTLLKKWHPSQVEEVGQVFEEDRENHINSRIKGVAIIAIAPHEIALLCEAGYLVKEEKCTKHESDGNVYTSDPAQYRCKKCGEYYYIIPQQEDHQLDLWTEMPPENTIYFSVEYKDSKLEAASHSWRNDMYDKTMFSSKNCHRTKKSAEEALKRLLEPNE